MQTNSEFFPMSLNRPGGGVPPNFFDLKKKKVEKSIVMKSQKNQLNWISGVSVLKFSEKGGA